MIVNINKANSEEYVDLFTKAYEHLINEGYNIAEKPENRFTSLAEYYGHMADLFETQKYRYVLVPLDEDPFEINLNTREITVPKSFSKCASIQTDLLAETIIFVCDRYFDFMDLANTPIHVQWTTPNKVQGATQVEMIDIESTPDKIKFAWPLNTAITEVPGKVQFSVCFSRTDPNTKETIYSLNTSPAEIVIKPALQPKGPTIVEKPINTDAFTKAIINSQFAEEGVSLPLQPEYAAPGNDIMPTIDDNMIQVETSFTDEEGNVKTKIENVVSLEDDTITLYVQAIAADAGEVKYTWHYKPEGAEKYYNCEQYPDPETGETIQFGTVFDYFKPIDNKEKVKNERYYYQDENSYKLYTGNFPAEIPLFEKCSAYTVHAAGDVTGHYHAEAVNQIRTGSGKVLETPYSVASSDCLLPGPRDVNITTNLKDETILKTEIVENEDETTEIHTATLEVEIEHDTYEPTITYEWRKSIVSEAETLAEDTEIISTDKALSITDAPGWYSVKVISTLNRKNDYEFSNVCKVTQKPVPPVVEEQENNISYPVKTKDQVLSVKASILNEENLGAQLVSDEIIYIWQKNLPDNGNKWITVTDKDKGVSGVGTASLTLTNELPHSIATFRCLVVNKLNGARAIFDHSGTYSPDEDEYLGEFIAEAPYIYDSELKNYTFIVTNF